MSGWGSPVRDRHTGTSYVPRERIEAIKEAASKQARDEAVKEYSAREAAIKRKFIETFEDKDREIAAKDEELSAKDGMITLLSPPKMAKNEYVEQTQAKYVFKCMDGDIQIPEYGILRTDFYYQEWITYFSLYIFFL